MTGQHQIIIVDDDLEDHLIMQEYFKESGNEGHVRFFTNGEEAIRHLDMIADRASLPRLIVLDLNMPILNGTQTLMRLKREFRYKDIPVIIFSTSNNENEKRKCLSMGALAYMVKPSSYDEGLRMVEKFNAYIS